ncbi:MAG: hypothetical protein ACI9HK_001498, partial [Pirellulaceae bacterium]
EIVTLTILADALCDADVVASTQCFNTHLVGVVVQRIGRTREVVCDPIIVSPPSDDR